MWSSRVTGRVGPALVVLLIAVFFAWAQGTQEPSQVKPIVPPPEAVETASPEPIVPEPEPVHTESPDALLTPLPDASFPPAQPVPQPSSSAPPAPADSTVPESSETRINQVSPEKQSDQKMPENNVEEKTSEKQTETSADNIRFDAFILDAGHGGIDPGVVGSDGIKEKDLTLSLAQGIGQALLSRGKQALFTRTEDRAMTASQRAALTKNRKNAVLVSLHIGRCVEAQAGAPITLAWDNGQTGQTPSVFIEQSRIFGEKLAAVLREKTYVVHTVTAPLRMQRTSETPVVLVECGCLENGAGRQMLTDETNRNALIQSLAEAIMAAAAP
mgnify:FL=1